MRRNYGLENHIPNSSLKIPLKRNRSPFNNKGKLKPIIKHNYMARLKCQPQESTFYILLEKDGIKI